MKTVYIVNYQDTYYNSIDGAIESVECDTCNVAYEDESAARKEVFAHAEEAYDDLALEQPDKCPVIIKDFANGTAKVTFKGGEYLYWLKSVKIG